MDKLTYQSRQVKYELYPKESRCFVTFSDGTSKNYLNLKASEPMDKSLEIANEAEAQPI